MLISICIIMLVAIAIVFFIWLSSRSNKVKVEIKKFTISGIEEQGHYEGTVYVYKPHYVSKAFPQFLQLIKNQNLVLLSYHYGYGDEEVDIEVKGRPEDIESFVQGFAILYGGMYSLHA